MSSQSSPSPPPPLAPRTGVPTGSSTAPILRRPHHHIPNAPYPPMMQSSSSPGESSNHHTAGSHSHGLLSSSSSLASAPAVLVSSSFAPDSSRSTTSASGLHPSSSSSSSAVLQMRFLQPQILACINHRTDASHQGAPRASSSSATTTFSSSSSLPDEDEGEMMMRMSGGSLPRLGETTTVSTHTGGSMSSSSSLKRSGPVLLQLRRVVYAPQASSSSTSASSSSSSSLTSSTTRGGLFTTQPLCTSRGNPSLGTSVWSTCLDVPAPLDPPLLGEGEEIGDDDDDHWGSWLPPPPCATGLSTGALCIHTFGPSAGSTAPGTTRSHPSKPASPWTAVVEYYHTPSRHQLRPATCVAWRNESVGIATSDGNIQPPRPWVAIGLSLPGASAPSFTPGLTSTAVLGRRGPVAGSLPTSSASSNVMIPDRSVSALLGSSPNNPAQTLGASSSASHLGGGGSTTPGRTAGTGDRDYCCFVWDVEHQPPLLQQPAVPSTASAARRSKSTALYKLSHQTGVASLAWLSMYGPSSSDDVMLPSTTGPTLVGAHPLHHHVLAVGGQLRNMHLYDLRQAAALGVATPVSTVYAHPYGVHGIRVDPCRPWQLVTYSRVAQEPIKLWDTRRLEAPLSEIKVAGSSSSSTLPGHLYPSAVAAATNIFSEPGVLTSPASSRQTITSVQWSRHEPGCFYVAMGDVVHQYDTMTSGSRPIHTSTVYTDEPLVELALYPFATSRASSAGPASSRILEDLLPKRMMAGLSDHHVVDLALHRHAPLALSPRDGRIVHGLGSTLWVGPPRLGSSSSTGVEEEDDMAATMMHRAMSARYGMDTKANIKLLRHDHQEADQRSSSRPDGGSTQLHREALLRAWVWLDRVEDLCHDPDEWGDDSWPARGLSDVGVWRLLHLDDGGVESEMQSFSETLACKVYDSKGRRAALTACGWAGKYNLEKILAECEEIGEYERSAAVAVWHGEIGMAVDALQRGAEEIRSQAKDLESSTLLPYAESLELVSLLIAGYRGGDNDSPSSNVWRKACSSLLERSDLSGSPQSGRVAYLRCIIKFLLANGTGEELQLVLEDETIGLCDRVAFACRFLALPHLKKFLEKCVSECQKSGNVEGVAITGLDKEGMFILQTFVDLTSDVQTAALITSRVIFPAECAERRMSEMWLDGYRGLLNQWQLWESRAMFDVDRADLLRKIKTSKSEGTSTTLAKSTPLARYVPQHQRGMAPPGRRSAIRSADPDIQASFPAQMEARCNYCSASLGLRRQQDSQTNQWLSKMKPVLSCCPQCRKPLPRCAICMLSLGAMNPFNEMRARAATPPPANKSSSYDDMSAVSNLPIAEWFTWCMRCKHGGHAHHFMGWFTKHEVCPVSGCDCRCQFDGTKALSRLPPSSR